MPRVKKKDHENLSSSNIEKVIGLLEADKPITKKEACEILNIAYNTARLQRIIDDFQDKKEFVRLRKSQNRGKPATDAEIREAIERYLSGDNVTSISAGLYRSPSFVRSIIERVGVPTKSDETVDYLPEECLSEDFSKGEVVWSARHHCPAIIKQELTVDYQAERLGFSDVNYEKKYGSKCYAIYVQEEVRELDDMWMRVDKGGYSAYALAYDLGKLTHLEKYGVQIEKL